MLNEGTVPKEAEEECTDQYKKYENKKRFYHLLKVAAFGDVGKHLLCTQKKKMTDCSNEHMRCFANRSRKGVRN